MAFQESPGEGNGNACRAFFNADAVYPIALLQKGGISFHLCAFVQEAPWNKAEDSIIHANMDALFTAAYFLSQVVFWAESVFEFGKGGGPQATC